MISEVMGSGGGVEAGEQVDEGGLEGVSSVVFSFGECGKTLGLAEVITGFCA